MMTEKEVAEFLEEAIDSLESDDRFDGQYTETIKVINAVGETKNTGLVIQFEDGSVFQITIVKSTEIQRKCGGKEG